MRPCVELISRTPIAKWQILQMLNFYLTRMDCPANFKGLISVAPILSAPILYAPYMTPKLSGPRNLTLVIFQDSRKPDHVATNGDT